MFTLTIVYNSGARVQGRYTTYKEILAGLEEYSDSTDIIRSFTIDIVHRCPSCDTLMYQPYRGFCSPQCYITETDNVTE